MHVFYLHNEQKIVHSVLSGLDWTRLASDPLNWTGLDQDHRITDLDWIVFFQMNPFHTLVCATPRTISWTSAARNLLRIAMGRSPNFDASAV